MREQIEEMARIICNLCTKDGCICDGGYCNYNCHDYEVATRLYNADYRKQEWISVDDRLPEEQEHVIVCGEDGLVGEAWHKKEGLFWWMDDRDGIAAATHWMPLPEPPKMKGGAE